MHRRNFLKTATILSACMLFDPSRAQSAKSIASPKPQISLWRGFNLIELFDDGRLRRYQESDFQFMVGWGFDFARLPCSYLNWSNANNWMIIDDLALQPVDEAIEFGRQYGVHINLCLHRIPGYCVNGREREPFQLFDSSQNSMQRALEAAAYHWRYLATRYKDVPGSRLSFNLFNEPPFMTDQSRYVEIAHALITAIREVNPDRLIFADGANIAQTPVFDLVDEGIVQSTRGYLPKMISHYDAAWLPPSAFESFATPAWPMEDRNGIVWNREKLRQELILTWGSLIERGAPVHVGEWGCFNRTPHDVCLAWMSDLLALWKDAGWGWALWNLRGPFGVLDSGRSDVTYENYDGHLLDRKMLELLVSN